MEGFVLLIVTGVGAAVGAGVITLLFPSLPFIPWFLFIWLVSWISIK